MSVGPGEEEEIDPPPPPDPDPDPIPPQYAGRVPHITSTNCCCKLNPNCTSLVIIKGDQGQPGTGDFFAGEYLFADAVMLKDSTLCNNIPGIFQCFLEWADEDEVLVLEASNFRYYRKRMRILLGQRSYRDPQTINNKRSQVFVESFVRRQNIFSLENVYGFFRQTINAPSLVRSPFLFPAPTPTNIANLSIYAPTNITISEANYLSNTAPCTGSFSPIVSGSIRVYTLCNDTVDGLLCNCDGNEGYYVTVVLEGCNGVKENSTFRFTNTNIDGTYTVPLLPVIPELMPEGISCIWHMFIRSQHNGAFIERRRLSNNVVDGAGDSLMLYVMRTTGGEYFLKISPLNTGSSTVSAIMAVFGNAVYSDWQGPLNCPDLGSLEYQVDPALDNSVVFEGATWTILNIE